MSEVMKKDDGKNRTDLLPVYPLEQVAAVLTFGAKKYTPNRWRKGMEWSRLYGAVLRHVFAWFRGQDTDPETGLSHLAHAICDLMFLLEYSRTGAGTDDREGKLKDAAAPEIPFIEDGEVYTQKGGTKVVLWANVTKAGEMVGKARRKFGMDVEGACILSFDGPRARYGKDGQYDLVQKIGKV